MPSDRSKPTGCYQPTGAGQKPPRRVKNQLSSVRRPAVALDRDEPIHATDPVDPASLPPCMRVTVGTHEAGFRVRYHPIDVAVVAWRQGREVILRDIAKALDDAADAADAAHEAVRLAGPKGELP